MGYEKISKEQRAAEIDRLLRARITDGTWPPGYVFHWPQLMEEFTLQPWEAQAVLGPVLKQMRIDGIIESRPYIGVRVTVDGEHWSPPAEFSNLPYDQYIEITLRRRLNDGRNGKGIYKPGEQFPSLSALAEEFGVSAATARKATDPLKQQNILVLLHPRTYINPNLAKFSTEALLTPSKRRRPGKMKLHAFGELRTLAEWAQDPRCKVTYKVLYSRYASGWILEEALSTPKVFSQIHPPKP
ncbi:GntR family transcriptional regulator [Streptomyces rubradiris]|uniref:GntR family transcriptional regulator n=1 Tax=Streptomyces rubradiris TaxID=285531 RepID=UPI0036EE19C7